MLKKTTKRFISAVMIVAMVALMPPFAAFAYETTTSGNAGSSTDSTTTWDGTTVETNWYNTSSNSYTISTAAQLAGLAELVNEGNSFSGKTITLNADIDLGGKEWTPIGTSGKPFSGTFEGSGKTISNLVINQPLKSDVGLFGYTTNGEIKDFTLNNASVTGYLDVGAIAGTPYTSKYTNINVTGTIKIEGFSYVGGALGKNAYANVTNVDVTSSSGSYVKANSIEGNIAYRTYVGGLVGFMGEGSHSVSDCNVKIDVIGSTCNIGGILGILHYGNTLTNCTYEGSLTLTTPGEPEDTEFGALTGTVMNKTSTTTISNCNATVLKASKGTVDVTDTITAHGDFYYSLNSTENTSGTVSVNATVNNKPVTIENNVAKIGNTGYKSFSSVIEALKGATYPLNEPLELLSDVSIDTWNQIWNVNGLTIKGNNHTITIGQVESNVNGNYLFYGAKNLNVSDVTIKFNTNGNGFSMVSGMLDNVKMIGGESSNYAVFVSASSEENDKVTVNNCTFENFDIAVYSQPAAVGNKTSDLSVNGSTFNNCDMTMCSYAPNTTFTNNTVKGGSEISFAGAAENADRDNTYTITGNTFQNAGKIWFYGADLSNVTFVKNKVLGTTSVSTDQAQSDTNLDVSKNYWGGDAPGKGQLSGSNIVGNDEYYTAPTMKDEDLNTYVPPTTGGGTVTPAPTPEPEEPSDSEETVTNPDGSTTTTITKEDGSSSTTTVDTDGKVESEVTVSKDAVDNADGSAVILPMPEVAVTTDKATAPTVTVNLPSKDATKVEVPVKDVTPGTVAVLVDADGNETVIKDTVQSDNGITLEVTDGATIKVMDNSKSFNDVADNYWGADAIDFATSRELFAGTAENTFSPEGDMTRAMIWSVLARYEGADIPGGTGSEWYAGPQQWAMENGISDGTMPNSSMTREQFAAMLYRYVGSPAVSGSIGNYSDADSISSWAQNAMVWAVRQGLIAGMGDGTLNPQGTATRTQVAAIFQRFIENKMA